MQRTVEYIKDFFCIAFRQSNELLCIIGRIGDKLYELYTTYQHKMWKTIKSPLFLRTFLVLLCIMLFFSCSSSKAPKKDKYALDNSLISMSEDDVRKRYGEPYMVSKTSENKIIWTYVPQWKILPDNKNTIYVEFEEGKVVKIIKAR